MCCVSKAAHDEKAEALINPTFSHHSLTKQTHAPNTQLIVQRVEANYAEPWRTRTQSSSSGTGFLVSGHRIITNAHVVRNCTHVRARKSLSPVMFSCTVEWVSIPLDLAVLSVNDEAAFFGSSTAASATEDAPSDKATTAAAGEEASAAAAAASVKDATASASSAAALASGLPLCPILPRLDENVTCVGFPRGGQQISVTRGVVSRLDAMAYGGEGRGERLLVVQIDAGVNSGTSGGPALDERGHVAGVAFSSYAGSADNIGYLVPASVVEAFLPV